jgi:ankyrin repeat protein
MKAILEGPAAPDVNAPSKFYDNLLYVAVKNGQRGAAQLLLDRGALVNLRFSPGNTVLMEAVEVGSHDLVQLLLNRGADVGATDSLGSTVITVAVRKRSVPMLQLLLGHYAKLNKKLDSASVASLPFLTGRDGNVELVRLLLDHGADINVRNRWGVSPLIRAVQDGNLEMVRLLLSYGSAATPSPGGWAGLTKTGVLESIRRWWWGPGSSRTADFQRRADVRLKDQEGKTALPYAVSQENLELVRLLVHHVASVQGLGEEDLDGSLKLAIWRRDQELPGLLRSRGMQIKGCEQLLRWLRLAVNAGAQAVMKLLPGFKGAPDVRGCGSAYYPSQPQPVLEAIQRGDRSTVAWLLDLGFNGFSDQHKNQWLLAATKQKELRIVELLLDHGADPNARDDDDGGQTALMLASRANESAVDLLLRRGADIEARDRRNNTPLHHAATWNRTEVVGLLLRRGANVNAMDEWNATALITAASKSKEAVDLLLRHGAELNARDKWGKTALLWAALVGNAHIVEFLLAQEGVDLSATLWGKTAEESATKEEVRLLLQVSGLTPAPLKAIRYCSRMCVLDFKPGRTDPCPGSKAPLSLVGRPPGPALP